MGSGVGVDEVIVRFLNVVRAKNSTGIFRRHDPTKIRAGFRTDVDQSSVNPLTVSVSQFVVN
jgi:hypothetical protein